MLLKNLWNRADIGMVNGDRNQQLLRLHIFHVLQSVSTNVIGMDVGVTSRGLSWRSLSRAYFLG